MVLLIIIFIAVVVLLGYVITSAKDTAPPGRGLNLSAGREKGAELKGASSGKENEAGLLSEKLRKSREDCQRLQEELARTRSNEAALQEELNKVKGWLEKDKGQEDNSRKEIYELKEKLLKKDQEYEKEFALSLSLKKESNEYKQRADGLENINRQNSERIRVLEAQNNAYKEELKSQSQALEELKKKNEGSQWVSKKEYDDLKAQLGQVNNSLKENASKNQGQ